MTATRVALCESPVQVASLLGSIWKGMSEEQQKPYRDQAKAAMDAWKAKQQAQQSA